MRSWYIQAQGPSRRRNIQGRRWPPSCTRKALTRSREQRGTTWVTRTHDEAVVLGVPFVDADIVVGLCRVKGAGVEEKYML